MSDLPSWEFMLILLLSLSLDMLDVIVVIFVRDHLSSTLRAEYIAKGHNMAVNLASRSEHFILTEEFVSLLQLVKDLKNSDVDIFLTDQTSPGNQSAAMAG